MVASTDPIRAVLDRIPSAPAGPRRFVVALAGPPAAGKSTLAASIVDALDGRAGLLAMDGFHLDNIVLDARGQRGRKGAPHTFDVGSFAVMLRALRADRQAELAVPVYDRALSVGRNCASLVTAEHEVLVVEGNYLLLDAEPWSELRPLFDLTVWLDVDLAIVEERIVERWASAGVDAEEIRRRTEENDLPNARLVHTGSVDADVVVSTQSHNAESEAHG